LSKPTIAITTGEPAGIGPDLCAALQQRDDATLVLLIDPALLEQRRALLKLTTESTVVHPVALHSAAEAGVLDAGNAPYVLETIRAATQGCLDGTFDAMVTAPVHKGVINDGGIAFSGHTEFIAALCQADPVMVLAAGDFRVALATTHLPLADVPAAINQQSLLSTLHILHDDLISKYQIPKPCILVCGLNPHAGESGHLGREEIDTIIPALQTAREQGLNITGPLPADTLFTPRHLQHADVVLAMYHDQGLPVLKYAGFGNAVNITFGLPIIRTSVDHGTALDLAGTGKADGGSLIAAIDLAVELALAKH